MREAAFEAVFPAAFDALSPIESSFASVKLRTEVTRGAAGARFENGHLVERVSAVAA